MSTTPDKSDSLSPTIAYTGIALVLAGVVLALLLPLLPQTVNNGTFLLFLAQSFACVSGFVVLQSNLRIPLVRYATIAIAVLTMLFLVGCFALTVGGGTESSRLVGQEYGLVISEVTFFLFSGGMDAILNAFHRRGHWVVVCAWLGNILAMTGVVLLWAHGHLMKSDDILTAAFVVSYVALPCTKYLSLLLTSSHGSRTLQISLGTFMLLPIPLGWVYLLDLTHPNLLPQWTFNSSLFVLAVEFGVSYIVDGILRNKKKNIPWHEFWQTMVLQSVFMVAVGIIGAFQPSNAPLLVGLLCMESLPNFPGGLAMFAEARKIRHWYSVAFSLMLCVLTVLCASTIFFQSYAVIAGGVTICLLQATPWAQVAQHACITWAERPKHTLFALTTALFIVTGYCIFFSLQVSLRGGGTEADLTALWYSIARIPSSLSLCSFSLLGVILVGERAPKVWRYLLLTCAVAIGAGFAWFLVAFYGGGSGTLIAPEFVLQVTGGVNVALLYNMFNSTEFQNMATAALARKATD